jgi:hypothetical protein
MKWPYSGSVELLASLLRRSPLERETERERGESAKFGGRYERQHRLHQLDVRGMWGQTQLRHVVLSDGIADLPSKRFRASAQPDRISWFFRRCMLLTAGLTYQRTSWLRYAPGNTYQPAPSTHRTTIKVLLRLSTAISVDDRCEPEPTRRQGSAHAAPMCAI